MRRLQRQETPKIPQQSDIVIDSDGRVHVSFFWDDLKTLHGLLPLESTPSRIANSIVRPTYLPLFTDAPDIQGEYKTCRLCPKKCGFDRLSQKHPKCGDWQLRVSTAGLSTGDEPVVSGHRGSGVVMLGGCPLKCPSCHNPEMVSGGKPISQLDLFRLAWDLAEQGAHNLQLLSPTVHIPALISVLNELKKAGYPLPIIFKSSGYEAVDQLTRFSGLIDVYLPDFKFGPHSSWGNRAGVRDYFQVVTETIKEMLRQVGMLEIGPEGTVQRGVIVRHVRAPLPAEETAKIEFILAGFSKLGAQISLLDNFVSLE